MYATIDELRSHLGGRPAPVDEAYARKMLHPFPSGAIVHRETFILERCIGKRVVEFGASGHLHEAMTKVATVFAIDRDSSDGIIGCDLDALSVDVFPIPDTAVDLLVCGETLEHLANPGWFLQRVKRQWSDVPMIVTVPNAFSSITQKHVARGLENVNIDHVAWYSPRTLTTLLTRYGFTITAFAYYNGDGPTAEGLIVVVA